MKKRRLSFLLLSAIKMYSSEFSETYNDFNDFMYHVTTELGTSESELKSLGVDLRKEYGR